MDESSSTGGCHSSESSSVPYDFDSTSKQSSNSLLTERTNIDALDDTARDTLIAPLENSNSCHSLQPAEKSSHDKHQHRLSESVHDQLDFEEDEDEGEVEDDDEDGEIEDDPEESADDEKQPPLICHKPKLNVEDGELESEEEEDAKSLEEGEVDDGKKASEELEEGEVTDDEERGKTKAICRFFGKGQCTWGSNCRFLHPGVTDRGLYTMFDQMKPLPQLFQPMVKTGLLGHAPPNFTPIIKLEEPVVESSWERGLRHAKEIIKQSVKRKENDLDFEEKKMNLSLAQEEIDKENDYYNRKSPKLLDSPPPLIPHSSRPPPALNISPPTGPPLDDFRGPGPDFEPDFRDRLHTKRVREAPPRDVPLREAPPLHEDVRLVRESAMRRRYDDYPPPMPRGRQMHHGGGFDDARKAEEWHDPWMRSPDEKRGRKDSIKKSYSSASSRSSSSSSKSSSSGSSKGSSKKKQKQKQRKVAPPLSRGAGARMSPKPVRIAPPLSVPKEEFPARRGGHGPPPQHYERERIMRYAPPQQQMLKKDDKIGIRPPPQQQPPTKKSWSSSRSRSRTRSRSFTPHHWSSKSRSRSPRPVKRRSKFVRGNRSSSSDRSRTRKSYSRSSSSSKSSLDDLKSSLQAKRKRPMGKSDGKPPEKMQKVDSELRNPRPIKQEKQPTPKSKSQIKLTLKPQSSAYKANKTVLDKLADDIDAEDSDETSPIASPAHDDLDAIEIENSNSPGGGQAPQRESRTSKERREELLKQLKAVEDAIAKKRSKMV